jgi:hypothetical protein
MTEHVHRARVHTIRNKRPSGVVRKAIVLANRSSLDNHNPRGEKKACVIATSSYVHTNTNRHKHTLSLWHTHANTHTHTQTRTQTQTHIQILIPTHKLSTNASTHIHTPICYIDPELPHTFLSSSSSSSRPKVGAVCLGQDATRGMPIY